MSDEKDSEKSLQSVEQPSDDQLEEALSVYEDDPIDHLSEKQVHAALMIAMSPNLTVKDVADAVGRKVKTIRKWQSDVYFQKFIKQTIKAYSKEVESRYVEKTKFLHDQLFTELTDRFINVPDQFTDLTTILGPDYTEDDKKRYLNRFAKNASFTDLMKVWGQVDKSVRLDNGEATARVEQKEFVDKTRLRYERRMIKRRKYKEFKETNAEVFEIRDGVTSVLPGASEAPAEVEVVEEIEEVQSILSEFSMED